MKSAIPVQRMMREGKKPKESRDVEA